MAEAPKKGTKGARKKAGAHTSSGTKRTQSTAAGKTGRKAPTRRAAPAQKRSSRAIFVAALVAAVLVVGGISVAIGTSDDGRIDVSATISQRASKLEEAGDTEGSKKTRAVSAPRQNDGEANGGLVGRGNKETEQQKQEAARREAVAEVGTTTATSSEEAATSSDETTESDGEVGGAATSSETANAPSS